MEVTLFTENLLKGHSSAYELAWYIVLKSRKILFVTSEAESFWQRLKNRGIPIAEIDTVLLPLGQGRAVRALESLLKENNKARFYLPRENYETYLCSICNKLMMYTRSDELLQWKNRIAFLDGLLDIGDGIQIFMDRKCEVHGLGQSFNLMFCEDGIRILFADTEKDATEIVKRRAETICGDHIHYLFSHGEGQECMERNCITDEQIGITNGQTISINVHAMMAH